MSFIRRFSDQVALTQELLFQSWLLPDVIEPFFPKGVVRGDVFPAVRADRVDFYHKGGKLFTFTAKRGFETHHKYASVILPAGNQQYVTDHNLKAIATFAQGYDRIKENCALYSGPEAAGVAEIYGRHSCAKKAPPSRVVVLDIEVSLARDQEGDHTELDSGQRTPMDRIDLLLMDDKGKLRFFEAKHYTNGEIRAKGEAVPRIVRQIGRYKKQLANQALRSELLAAYREHVGVINSVFHPRKPLPQPSDVDPIPRLLVFGFDAMQQKKLDVELKKLKRDHDVLAYMIGDIRKVNPVTLFRGNPRWAAKG